METDFQPDEKTIQIMDILQQIKQLNEQISQHVQHSKSTFMIEQYQDMRQRFVEQLKVLLSEYQLVIQSQAA